MYRSGREKVQTDRDARRHSWEYLPKRVMRICSMGLACALTAGLAAHGFAGVRPDNFGGQLTLTTDYVFRGVSYSDEKPALQAGFEFTHDSGFFTGIWGSNVDFPDDANREVPGPREIDIYLGIDRELGREWSGIATLIRYEYPGSDSDLDFSYTETIVGLRYREQIAAFVAYTDSAFGSDEPSLTYELSALYPAPFYLDLSVGLGYSDLDNALGYNYGFWKLGVSRTLSRFTVGLSYFGTEDVARKIWGELAGDRLVVSVTATIR